MTIQDQLYEIKKNNSGKELVTTQMLDLCLAKLKKIETLLGNKKLVLADSIRNILYNP